MQRLVLLSAVTCVLGACSLKEEACDMTGQRYSKMAREGIPLTEKDKACVQAIMIKSFEDVQKQMKADLDKHIANEKARRSKQMDSKK